MPKRTVWLTAGLVVGAGSSLWAERRIRRAVEDATESLRPTALGADAARSAGSQLGVIGRQVASSIGRRRSGTPTLPERRFERPAAGRTSAAGGRR